MHAYMLRLDKMETIQTVMRGLKWSPAFEIRIPGGDEQAIAEQEYDMAQVKGHR
jgi:hypothetical protein